jgi:protein-S-isoprenylcysteine O-methyltransferase Ste14
MQIATWIDPIEAKRRVRALARRMTTRRWMDLVEQVVATLLFVWLFVRLWPDSFSSGNVVGILLLLLSEGIVVVLLLLRRPTERISADAWDWIIAAAGTFLPLLVIKGGEAIWGPLGASLLVLGILVHLSAKLCLGRSFGLVAANRGVEVRGLYALVRHPMYLGYMVCHIGYLLFAPALLNAALYAVVWLLLIARTIAEERILSQDPRYRDYSARVRYRLVPGVF